MKTYTKYLLISYGLSVVITISRAFSKTDTLSILEHVYYFIAMGFFLGSFAYLGKLVRDFVMPDAIMTTGAVDTFKQKIFWMVGPQVIGAVIGLIATEGLHKTLFLDKPHSAPAYQNQHYQKPQSENQVMDDAEVDPSTLTDENN